jgi:two-component system sensor histidine kinase UhpB
VYFFIMKQIIQADCCRRQGKFPEASRIWYKNCSDELQTKNERRHMDLRRRLIGSLGLLLGSLMVMATLIQLHSLRTDIEAEVDASARLVNVLLAAGNGQPLQERLAQAGIRHLSIRSAGQAASAEPPHPMLGWLGLSPSGRDEQEIRIGNQVLYIAPNPGSEISERLSDTVRIWITLLLFSATTLFVAWCCADRALRPVRALEDGLQRLARGDQDPALPAFALREFRRVAGAIERLAQALAESRAAQRALARQLISVQEDERRALARELHDEIGQTLTALSVTAAHLARNAERLTPGAVAECASDLRRDIRISGQQLRAMLKALRPHGLHASGLAQSLRELIDGWRSRATGIEFTLSLQAPLPAMSETTALTLYRVVQEAVTNVVRHSGARHCTVQVMSTEAQLQVQIADDGCGLPATGPARRGGLLGMVERLDMVGGQLELLPNPAGGLRLLAILPAHCKGEEIRCAFEGALA